MRLLAPVLAGLFVVSGIVSAMLWRDLRNDRQIISELRTQLAEARAAQGARSQAPPAAASESQPSGAPPPPGDAPAAPAAQPAKVAAREAVAVFVAEGAKRQQALLKDSEYRKARIEQAKANLKRRYTGLAEELEISERQADSILQLLAESQILQEEEATERLTSGVAPDAAAMADLARAEMARQQKQKEALVAMLGATRYEQFQDFEHLQPSRSRVNNLTTLLAREGRPLTTAQSKSLSALIVAEQKRMEQESKALRDAGQGSQQAPFQQREAEANRRILEGAAAFLDAQQMEKIRGRFEQRAAIGRANDRVQQTQREATQ